MQDLAISISSLTKTYHLYSSPVDRVKETFHPFRKKYHHDFHALKDVSMEVRKGEFVGIIGRNGSGKSTLLQLITGILQPTSGTVTVNGQISALLELGAGFNPEFTGRENVFLNGSILGVSKTELQKNFGNIEAFADIGDFIDQPVKTYSSGMYVRLAFAIAINVKPDIFIVDEALAVGDMFFQQKCIRHMEENMKECTKVLVTHDMHAVTNLCQRVIVLDRGALIFSGSPLEGVEHYTKAIHNELFRKTSGTVEDRASDPGSLAAGGGGDADGWISVSSDSIAGASQVVIRKVSLLSASMEPAATAIAGDVLHIRMLVEAFACLDGVIFGYTIKDRVGNGIAGDNSLSLLERRFCLRPGLQVVTLSFIWPAIAPDEYIFTLGIGQGDHPLHHVIQCWAHNVLVIKALSTGKVVHGIFTNPLLDCEVAEIA